MDVYYTAAKAYYKDNTKEGEMKTAKGEVEKLEPKPDLKVIETAANSEYNLEKHIEDKFSGNVG